MSLEARSIGDVVQALPPRSDRMLIVGAATALQSVYLAAVPLAFECDAATFYAFAKAVVGAPGGLMSSARAPLFPIFLGLTGTVWPGTFIVVILAQAAMGIALPILVYRILYSLGRRPALFGALLIMASTVPFVGAKVILAEQLYAFLTVLSLAFLARYADRQNSVDIYAFAAAGLAAMLTRWEAEVLVAFGLVGLVTLALKRGQHLRHVIASVGLIAVVLAGYSIVRASALGDWRLVGSLQSGTGFQLFQRLYLLDPALVDGLASPYLRERMARGSEPIAAAMVPVPGAPAQYVRPANGSATRQLRELVLVHTSEHPEGYRVLEPLLDQSAREANAPPEGPYQELFGQFDGDPSALVDNIFRSRANFRVAHYAIYMANVAQQVMGPVASDRLLLAVGLEAARANPRAVVAMIADGFTMTGIALEGLREVVRGPFRLDSWRDTYPLWDIFDYSRVPFDAGGCASIALSPSMMAEYRLDQRLTDNDFARGAVHYGAFGRNLVRAICGTIFVLGWWLLLIAPRRILTLPVMFTIAVLMITVGISVAGGNTKYDLGFMPLLVVAAVSIVTEGRRRIRWRGGPQSANAAPPAPDQT